MKQLLLSLLIISVMSVMLGQGVVSFMSDIETSEGNTFTAGTIDLQVDDQDHPPALITLPDLEPCHPRDVELSYSNVGTNPGTVTLVASYDESDNEELDTDPDFEFSAGPPEDPWAPEYEVSEDGFAKKVFITKAEAEVDGDVVNLMPTMILYAEGVCPVGPVDGKVSIYEFAWMAYPCPPYEPPYGPTDRTERDWPLTEVLFPQPQPGSSETLTLRFHLDYGAGNEYQADGIVSTLNFEMRQWLLDRSMVLDLEMNEGPPNTEAHDSSLYGNHGTIYEAAWVSDAPYGPYRGSALHFDGEDDYVDCGNDASLDLTEAATVEAWINIETYSVVQRIVSKLGDAPRNGYDLYVGITSGDDGYVRWVVARNGEFAYPYSTTELSLNTWYHVVGTFDGGTARLYINGREENAMEAAGPIGSTPVNLNVGRWPGGSYHFNGIIDRVRVYNRALSQAEVFQSYLVSYSHYHGAP